MSKINKIKSVVIMLLASVLMLTASMFVANVKPQAVRAEGEKVFVMSDVIQARVSTPAGLRFRTYLDAATKEAIESAEDVEFGMIIAPAVNFDNATSADYLAEGAMVDKVVVQLSQDKLTLATDGDESSKAFAQAYGEDIYFINAVLYNILEKNWYLDFSAVAYYSIDGVVTYANYEGVRANIGSILEDAFYDVDGNSETRGQLLEHFNYGGTEPKEVTESIVPDYTVPAHAIPVNQSNFNFIATLPYAHDGDGDEAYAYKLTENITISTNEADSTSSLAAAGLIYDTMFQGKIDGQGHKLTLNLRSASTTIWATFKTIGPKAVIENTTIVANYASALGGGSYGILALDMWGTMRNCVISLTSKSLSSWGYIALVRTLNSTAKMENLVITNMGPGSYGQNITGPIAGNAASTQAVIKNVAYISNTTGWAYSGGYNLGTLLPKSKCNVSNVYVYTSVANALAGTATYALDNEKYAAEDAPANITWASGNSTDENLAVLYNKDATMSIKDLVGFDVIAADHTYYTDTDVTATIPSVDIAGVESRTTIELSADSLDMITGTAQTLTATVKIDGVEVVSPAIVWSTENDKVATVANGVVTPVGIGTTQITATFYGISVSCEVTVEANWVTVTTAEDFVALVQSNRAAFIKLGANLVLNNENIQANATPGFGGSTVVPYTGGVASQFAGAIDGQGYTITINSNTTSRPNGVLFGWLDGTIKNTNFVVRTNNWCSGNTEKMGTVVGTLNGTIENCVVTFNSTKFGNGWSLQFAFVGAMGEDAVVKNTVFYAQSGVNNYTVWADKYQATSKFENFAIVDASVTSSTIANAQIGMDIDGLYIFKGVADLLAGDVAYAYNGSAIAESTETINFAEVFGYELTVASFAVRSGTYHDADGSYSDVEQIITAPIIYDAAIAAGVEVAVSQPTLTLTAGGEAGTLTASATKNGAPIEALFAWTSDNENVATVVDGVVTPVGVGSATINAVYYGVSASCVVTVEPVWEIVTTGEQFIATIQANPSACIKLANDITIKNKTVAGGIASYRDFIVDTFNGIIDGQGYTLTSITTEDGRVDADFFVTMNGTIKNIQIISTRSDWGDGTSRKVGFITNMNGTIENSSITVYYHRFGTSWNIVWSLIENVGADAVIRNTIFNHETGDLSALIKTISASATLENVGVVSSNIGTLYTTAGVTGNQENVYYFSSISNLVSGAPSYKYADGAVVATTETIDATAVFGYEIVPTVVSLDVYNSADVVNKALTFPFLCDPEIAKTIEISVSEPTLTLVQGGEGAQLSANVTKDGNAIAPTIAWRSSNTAAATVDANGNVTPVGAGTAKIVATYYGKSAACIVSIDPASWTVVETAADFVTAVQANGYVKLNADIVVKARYYSDGISSVATYLADTFNGIIDGQGHTLTLMISDLRPAAGMFVTLNGTIKNLNVINIRSDWGDGTRRAVGFITNMNGVIDNCVITTRWHRWNISYNIAWSFLENVGADAIIMNTVFNKALDLNAIASNIAIGATFSNVAFIIGVDTFGALYNKIPTTGNYEDVYMFSDIENFLNGAASAYFKDGAIVSYTEEEIPTIDVAAVFGAQFTSSEMTINHQIKASAVDNGTFEDLTLVVPVWAVDAE